MDIYETRRNVLRALIGDNTLKDFASAFDSVDASYLSQILNGHRRLGEKAAMNLAVRLGIAPGVLLIGRYSAETLFQIGRAWAAKSLKPPALAHGVTFGKPLSEFQGVETIAATYPPIKPKRLESVPVLGKAMLGPNGFFDAMDYPSGHGDGYLEIPSDDESAYALRVVGSSMHPRIKNGEYVLIEPNHQYLPGDEVLVRTRDGRAMVKEFIYAREGQHRFDSISDGYPPVFLDDEEVVAVHYVAGILKPSKYNPG